MTEPKIERWIDEAIEGVISEADWLCLEGEMWADPGVRRAYIDRVELDLNLRSIAADESGSIGVTEALRRPTRIRRGWPVMAVVASIAASIIATCVWVWPRGDDASNVAISGATDGSNERSAFGFAVLVGQSDAKFDDVVLSEGDLFPTGTLHLRSGTVHAELFSGVELVIGGEATFSIDSPMQLTLSDGAVRADVPRPARGFKVVSPTGDIIDLGTEFSVGVTDGETDVHVVSGEVDLLSGSQVRRLSTGAAVHIDGDGGMDDAAVSTSLIGPDEFSSTRRDRLRAARRRWADGIGRWDRDPRCIARYALDAGEDRKVSNQVVEIQDHATATAPATASAHAASSGTVVVTRPTEDRWGRAGSALDFSRLGSRVRINAPGRHRGLTLSCWVKINSLDRLYNSLLLTDGHEDFEPHWQLMRDGRVFFSVKTASRNGDQHPFYSPVVWGPADAGRWMMLSVTFDIDRRTVAHYVNGQITSRHIVPKAAAVPHVTIGRASICNWNEPMYRTDPEFVVRNLNGSMDEMSIYNEALTADEIRELFNLGNPNED